MDDALHPHRQRTSKSHTGRTQERRSSQVLFVSEKLACLEI